MNPTPVTNAYSANVRLQLEIGERVYELAQVGPGLVVFSDPVNLPPCEGDVILHVDNKLRRWRVQIPDGVQRDVPITRTIQCG